MKIRCRETAPVSPALQIAMLPSVTRAIVDLIIRRGFAEVTIDGPDGSSVTFFQCEAAPR